MISVYIFHFLLLFFAVWSSAEAEGQQKSYGSLWCQQGEKKDYSPVQCPPETLECFKFVCDKIEEPFIARGCGVSVLTTAAGLPNESCHQAQSMCEYIGGRSSCETCGNKHMCNKSSAFNYFPAFLTALTSYFCFW